MVGKGGKGGGEGRGQGKGGKGKGRGVDWVNISDQVEVLEEESWDQYWAEMDGAEALEFLEDPKQALVDAGLIDEDYQIQTHIVNADVASVAGPVVCQVLMVFHDEKMAKLTVYRHPHGEEPHASE